MTDSAVAPSAPSRTLAQRAPDLAVWGLLLILLMVSFHPVEMHNASKLFTNSQNMREFGAELMHPDFTQWRLYVSKMWLTVQIAIWGTFLAVFIAVQFGLACRATSRPWAPAAHAAASTAAFGAACV